MFIDEKLGSLLQELRERDDLNFVQKQNVLLSLEDFNKLKKFSSSFVRKLSEAVSTSFHAWIEARKKNSFSIFEPALAHIVDLKREEAHLLGYQSHPYNALMNEFEKGATVEMIDKVFADLTPQLSALLREVQQFDTPDDSFLYQNFPKQQQWAWGMYIAKNLGFDFEAGRQDISEHPFTTNFNSRDVRITTRIDENDFSNMMWSTIHEVGHGLYEQGLPDSHYGLPSGEYASLSIHESQSRLWENCVGRGASFWKYYLPKMKEFFPGKLDGISLQNFLKGINKVNPSLIRTEADELTYHFHVMIRYELEKQLIAGTISVKDIPAFWNEQYKKLLNVNVPDDKRGCLQDVHWSHGSFGYFATYSLGSLYAAQFWEQARKDVPQFEDQIINFGETQLLLGWLRSKVHAVGRTYNSGQLCEAITHKPLDSTVFVNYLQMKIKTIFG